jgi:hypothetical protein
MYHLQYSYIEKPTTLHVSRFFRALADHGVSVSHLGRSDPPRKFRGSVDEVVCLISSRKTLLARLTCSSQFEVFPAEVRTSLGRLLM